MTCAEIGSMAELRELLGVPTWRAVTKERTRPILALLVEIDQIFFHCPKAFIRSQRWEPQSWRPEALPSTAALTKAVQEPRKRWKS